MVRSSPHFVLAWASFALGCAIGPRPRDVFLDANKKTPAQRIIYVNMDAAVERRSAMEQNLTALGIPYERSPGVALNGSGLTNENIQQLTSIFSDWKCGNWTNASCATEDRMCCWGFQDVAPSSDSIAYLSDLAAHIAVFKRIRNESMTRGSELVVVSDDDARFSSQWEGRLSQVLPLAGQWDVLKLHSYAARHALRSCPRTCSAEDHVQCVFSVGVAPCIFSSNAVLLVNSGKIDKILAALEKQSQSSSYQVLVEQQVTRSTNRFGLDQLLQLCAADGSLDVKAPWPPLASIVDNQMNLQSNFNLF